MPATPLARTLLSITPILKEIHGHPVDKEASRVQTNRWPGDSRVFRLGPARTYLPRARIVNIEAEGQIERAHTRNQGDKGVE
jgi:hypothetical protein